MPYRAFISVCILNFIVHADFEKCVDKFLYIAILRFNLNKGQIDG